MNQDSEISVLDGGEAYKGLFSPAVLAALEDDLKINVVDDLIFILTSQMGFSHRIGSTVTKSRAPP